MQTQPDHTATTAQLGRYEIDTSSSAVTFRTRHLFGLAPVRGTFAIRSGTIDVAEPLAGSTIHAEIEAASFHTGNPRRDSTVRSARFLDARQHPVMTFTCERVAPDALGGMLTVGDITRPISLKIVHYADAGRCFTARATTRIDRTEFGITAARGLAARNLDLTVEAQCARN